LTISDHAVVDERQGYDTPGQGRSTDVHVQFNGVTVSFTTQRRHYGHAQR